MQHHPENHAFFNCLQKYAVGLAYKTLIRLRCAECLVFSCRMSSQCYFLRYYQNSLYHTNFHFTIQIGMKHVIQPISTNLSKNAYSPELSAWLSIVRGIDSPVCLLICLNRHSFICLDANAIHTKLHSCTVV